MAVGYKGMNVTWGDKISKAKMNHGWPDGYHERQSKAQKKRFKTEDAWNKGMVFGKARWFWKDNHQEYVNLHRRISRKFGKPKMCEICGRTDLEKYEWANKSGKYLEDRLDWLRLCRKCHIKYDNIKQKL